MTDSSFYPLSQWRTDVLVSLGVSARFTDEDIRGALRAHGSLREKATTRVQVGHLGSLCIVSNPRLGRTFIVQPSELRRLQKEGRL